MSNYKNYVAEDRRLVILRILNEEPDYAINDSVLQTALSQIGHGVSRDVIRTDLSWLEEQGLVSVEVIKDKIHVAKLTARGGDVASGRAVVYGVKKPAPGE
ncbi:MAG: ArsR family transcriptional regulator [Alphaproteobacteria bacterium]|nr:ArsR family transcriptional regulator [Alphaproteobacteria bacterium]